VHRAVFGIYHRITIAKTIAAICAPFWPAATIIGAVITRITIFCHLQHFPANTALVFAFHAALGMVKVAVTIRASHSAYRKCDANWNIRIRFVVEIVK
jgi:hypothetical protein